MEINENKTEINFYSLESFEYGDNKNNLMSLTLYDLKISSKEAHFEFEKHSKSFKVKFPVLYKDLIELLKPLKEEIKLIEKYETYTKEINGHQITRKKNYLPTSSWETSVNFFFSIDDINKLFYITDFKNFFNQNLNCELFIYLNKFNYNGESAFAYLIKHMGYRYVLKKVTFEFPGNVSDIDINLEIENKGFAKLPYHRKKVMTVLFEKDGSVVLEKKNPNLVFEGTDKSFTINTEILPEGTYTVYLKISDTDGSYPVRFANDLWNDELKANKIGVITK